MTTIPYEFLARMNRDGTVAGAHVLNLEDNNGQLREGGYIALSDTTDPAYAKFAADFSAAVIAERDALKAKVASLTDQLDSLTAGNQTLITENGKLKSQLDGLIDPPVNPRHIAPFDFLGLFTDIEKVAIFSSNDPKIIIGRAQLQTITSYVDLDATETVGLVYYIEQLGLIALGRAAEILSGKATP